MPASPLHHKLLDLEGGERERYADTKGTEGTCSGQKDRGGVPALLGLTDSVLPGFLRANQISQV